MIRQIWSCIDYRWWVRHRWFLWRRRRLIRWYRRWPVWFDLWRLARWLVWGNGERIVVSIHWCVRKILHGAFSVVGKLAVALAHGCFLNLSKSTVAVQSRWMVISSAANVFNDWWHRRGGHSRHPGGWYFLQTERERQADAIR